MADNRDWQGKSQTEIDYGSSTTEAFKKRERETKAQSRKKLAMCKVKTSTIVAKHEEEVEVNRIRAKLELLDDLNQSSSLMSENVKLRANLKLAKKKMADVKVPNIDWFKLGEPDIY